MSGRRTHRIDVECGATPQEYSEVAGLEQASGYEDLHRHQQNKRQFILLVKPSVDVPVTHVRHGLDYVRHPASHSERKRSNFHVGHGGEGAVITATRCTVDGFFGI